MRSMKFLAPAVVAVTILCAPAAAGVTSVGGGAFGASLSGVVTVLPSPSVDLPSTGGGPFQATQASVNVVDLLSTGVLNVSTQGSLASGVVDSSADVANVSVQPMLLAAEAVQSSCSMNGSTPVGSSTLTNATLAGVDLPSVPTPNVTITVLGLGYIVLNEQLPDTTPGMNGMTVNAIHVFLHPGVLGLEQEITIAQSRCSASAATTAVRLQSFSASRTHQGVLLRWRTGANAGTLGYNVYRQQGAKRVKLNNGLVAGGASLRVSSYSFLVRHARAGQYWLQAVGANGSRTWFGSAAA
jgi:hypothetical protein